MTNISKSFGLETTVVKDDITADISTSYSDDSFSFSASISGKGLDLKETVKQRFNDLNVVLPENSAIPIAQISGTVAKQGTDGADRAFTFQGNIANITIPIPLLPDITINQAYFYYDYLSKAAPVGGQADFSEQVISIGCEVTLDGTLKSAISGAKTTGAYFLSNNASLIYLDFSGTINVGQLLSAVFGGSFPNLTIDIESAGILRVAKQNKVTTGTGKDEKTTVPGITYSQALSQITAKQKNVTVPTGNTKAHMPLSFPLDQMPTDFAQQFGEAFSADNITGICFWVVMDFDQITLFKSLLTIGYDQAINGLALYGFRTQTIPPKTAHGPATPTLTNSALYASIPPFTLLSIFEFSGNQGRTNILFQYTSNLHQYKLSGSVAFTPFEGGKSLVFSGDLTVNDKKLTATLDLSTESPTQSLDAPLGMTGINFAELFLEIDHTFAQTTPQKVEASTDLVIGGKVNLSALHNNFDLEASIVFEKSEPRLALVTLSATPVLTLYDFVTVVVKKPWAWVSDITKAIGFVSGSMYYLKCPKTLTKADCVKYTFQYTPPSGKATTYTSGYHVVAVLQFFEKYNFQITLDVEDDGIKVQGTYAGTTQTPGDTLSIYFITITAPALDISTIGGAKTFGVSAQKVTLFGTDIGDNITMQYGDGIFTGSYTLPSPKITVDWQWTQDDFSITNITGIPQGLVDAAKAIEALVKQINKAGGGSTCSQLVSDAFNGLVKTNISLALTTGEKPSQSSKSPGKMSVPLTITTALTIAGENVATIPVNFSVEFDIPTSLKDLPSAIWGTLTDADNLNTIFGKILTQPGTYKAIAVIIAKKVGGSIAADMLCNTEDEALAEEVAEALEAALEAGEIAGGIEGLADLGGAIVAAVAASAASAVVGFLKEAWDTIKSWFTGGKTEKEKAEDKINALISSTEKSLKDIEGQITKAVAKIATKITVKDLTVSVDKDDNFVANWDFLSTDLLGEQGKDSKRPKIDYQLSFLKGSVGTHVASEEPGLPTSGFVSMNNLSYSTSWNELLEKAPNYQMNAAIQTSITGYTFINSTTRDNLNSATSNLQSIQDKVDSDTADNIKNFVKSVNDFITKMDNYHTEGLTSPVVYATTTNSASFVLGESLLGIDTIIQ